MRDGEIAAHFDGRGRAELVLSRSDGCQADRATLIGYQFGYALREAESVGRGTYRMVFARDDSLHEGLRLEPTADGGWQYPPLPWEVASAQRRIAEAAHSSPVPLVLVCALAAAALAALGWRLADVSSAATAAALCAAVLLAAGAVLAPLVTRRRQRRHRETVERFLGQRAAGVRDAR